MLGGRIGGLALCLLSCTVCLSRAGWAQQSFTLRAIVEENRPTSLGTFRNVAVQGVAMQGPVLFLADRDGLLSGDDQALFLWVNNEIVRLIGRDNKVPGGRIQRITAASLAPRSAADRAFLATVRTDSGATEEALYVSAEGRLRRVVRAGETVGPGRFLGAVEGGFQVNGRGEVLLLARLDLDGDGAFSEAADTVALFFYNGDELKLLARRGETLLGGTVTDLGLHGRALNDNGRAAWEAKIDLGETGANAVVVSDRGGRRYLVRSGDSTQGGRLLNPRDPVLNEPGNVAFMAELDVNGNGRVDAGKDETGAFLFRPQGGGPTTLTLLRSARLERGDSAISTIQALNNYNEATVECQVDTNQNGRLDEGDREAHYLAATSGVAALARGGRRLPAGNDLHGGELRLGSAMMNNYPEVAIGGFVDVNADGVIDPERDEGILLFAGDGGLTAVARDGQFFNTSSSRGQLLNVRGPSGLTDAGVIVFTADLDRDMDDRIRSAGEGRVILLAIPLSQ